MMNRAAALEHLYRLLVLVSLWGGSVTEGYAPHYDPGLMGAVADRRDMAQSSCMVSSPVYPLGTRLYVYGARTGALLRCQVVDVSHPRDKARHLRTKRLVELSYESARALCGTVRGNSIECPVLVVRLGT